MQYRWLAQMQYRACSYAIPTLCSGAKPVAHRVPWQSLENKKRCRSLFFEMPPQRIFIAPALLSGCSKII